MKTQIKSVVSSKNSKRTTTKEVSLSGAKSTKKTPKINENVQLRRIVKSKYLETTRSANGIVKFCKGEGLEQTQAFIDYLNKSNKSKLNISALTVKSFLSNLTRYERFKSVKEGNKYVITEVKKEYFSTHQVCNVLSRLSKNSK